MLLGEVINFKNDILGYCDDQNYAETMLSALDEDLAIDSYLENQPGGIGTMSKHYKDVDKYENILNKLNVESVFGDAYTNASEQQQQAMNYHLTALEKIYSNSYSGPSEFTQFYQALNLTDQLCNYNSGFKELELSPEITDKMLAAANEIRSSMLSWEDETETVIENIDMDHIAQKYFSEQVALFKSKDSDHEKDVAQVESLVDLEKTNSDSYEELKAEGLYFGVKGTGELAFKEYHSSLESKMMESIKAIDLDQDYSLEL